LLRDNDIEPTVIEMNRETVRRLHEDGVPAVHGDAGHRETLTSAGVDRAGTLVLSASGIRGAAEVIRLARELNPKVRVLVRSAYLRERPALQQAGADGVFSGEGEVALAMTESLLRALGAVPEQIDRERDRVRMELFGGPQPAQALAAAGEPGTAVPGAPPGPEGRQEPNDPNTDRPCVPPSGGPPPGSPGGTP
jgi:CPA2 family monovalent cation:H+ antiporter-2